jgi:hypothetical protein
MMLCSAGWSADARVSQRRGRWQCAMRRATRRVSVCAPGLDLLAHAARDAHRVHRHAQLAAVRPCTRGRERPVRRQHSATRRSAREGRRTTRAPANGSSAASPAPLAGATSAAAFAAARLTGSTRSRRRSRSGAGLQAAAASWGRLAAPHALCGRSATLCVDVTAAAGARASSCARQERVHAPETPACARVLRRRPADVAASMVLPSPPARALPAQE